MKTLDWIGYILLLGGVTPLLMGFAWSSDPNYGWHDAHSYGAVAAGAAVLILCVLWGTFHHRFSRERGSNPPSNHRVEGHLDRFP